MRKRAGGTPGDVNMKKQFIGKTVAKQTKYLADEQALAVRKKNGEAI